MGPANEVLAEATSAEDMAGLTPADFEPAFLKLVADWNLPERLPVLACGIVGTREGWAEAPCSAVPCPPAGGSVVSAAARDPRLDVHVLPGLVQTAPPDVMHGDETRIAGFLAAEPSFDGTLCLPGAHTRWVQISAGEVVSFRTAMTGELFALLSDHSVLRQHLGTGWDDAAFDTALTDALSRPEALAARLFGLRAGTLLAEVSPNAARARASGLLIGAELAAMKPYWLGAEVAVAGAPGLTRLYVRGLAAQGVEARQVAGDVLTLAGLVAARHQRKPAT